MAGAVADRELSTRFAVATAADDAAIRRLLRENPMRGAIDVSFEREPDYFRGANLAGGEDQTIVAFSNGRLVCMGRCTRRDCWVDGAVRRVGYLSELRLDESARGRFGVLRVGYEFFRAQQVDHPAELYFTSIAADNDRARRVFERGVRGLPKYEFLAELETALIAMPQRSPAARVQIERATEADFPALVRLLNECGRAHQFAPVWNVEMLRLWPAQIYLVWERGKIIACAGLWDQRGFRQTVIRGYSRGLSLARPFVNFASQVFGTPPLPPRGSALAHAFLSPLAATDGSMLPDLIAACFRPAAKLGVEFLTLAIAAGDPLSPALQRRFPVRSWRSRLYRVNWPDSPSDDLVGEGRPFLPDVALL